MASGAFARVLRLFIGLITISTVKMSSETKTCYIYSVDNSLPAVYLPDKTETYVGRSVDTKITDTKCSRQQVWLYASYADRRVFVKQLGPHASGLNGFKMQRDEKLVAKHGDQLEILYGKYFYKIEFNPAPAEESQPESLKKRLHDSGSEDDEAKWNKKIKMKDGEEAKEISNAKSMDMENDDEAMNEKVCTTKDSHLFKETSERGCNGEIELSECSVAKPAERALWEEINNKTLLIYTSKGVESRSKIAAYDMDGTLIKTKSGTVFPKDCNDWQIIFPEVPGKLKKHHKDGYKIVIFTNQGGLGVGKVKPSDFKVKIERIVEKLGVPIQVFIAVGKGSYRKPATGMWDTLVENKNDGIVVDKAASFFVGDAAGRPKDWAPKKKKDHSFADRLLALNLDLKFQTPEEHFLGHKPARYELPIFDPKSLDANADICDPPDAKITSDKQELVILVGGPGSGKSHVAKTHMSTYEHVNRDTLGSWQKCVSAVDQALAQGKSVVVDNTNPDPASRKKYVEVAKIHKVPIRCFVMTTGSVHAKHNNKFRQLTDHTHETISDIIINSYTDARSQLVWRCVRFLKLIVLLTLHLYVHLFTALQPYRKNFKPPSLGEGFEEIVRINFVPNFKNDDHRKLYQMYLLEK